MIKQRKYFRESFINLALGTYRMPLDFYILDSSDCYNFIHGANACFLAQTLQGVKVTLRNIEKERGREKEEGKEREGGGVGERGGEGERGRGSGRARKLAR